MNHSYKLWGHQLLLAFIILLAGAEAHAQTPAWQALLSTSGSHNAEVTSMAADASGNLILVGYFNGQMSLGNGVALTATGPSNGYDAFVAKWNPATQRFVWAVGAGGSTSESADGVAVSGNAIYITGSFNSPTAVFGNTTLTRAGNGQGGSGDMFVAKLTDAGSSASFTWALRAGGNDNDQATDIAVNGSSVYVAGFYASSAIAFSPTLTLPNPGNFGTLDGFVAKLTDAGGTASFTWAQRISADNTDVAYALAVQANNVYVAGYISSTSIARFGTLTVPVVGSRDGFVAKLTDAGASGSFTWVRTTAGPAEEEFRDLVVSGTGLYAVGTFSGSTLTLGTATLPNAGPATTRDILVAKLTDAGPTASFGWAQAAGGTGNDFAYGLAVAGARLYVAGSFVSSSMIVGGTTLANAGGVDVWVAGLFDAGASGSFMWALQAGSTRPELANALVATSTGVIVGGYAGALATFGAFSVPGPSPFQSAFVATVADGVLATRHPLEAALRLAPNPAHGRASVQLPAGTGPATLTILNALGRPVRVQTAATGATAELDLSGLAPGLYAVRVETGGRSATQKLLVE
jgi:hypothetical protein